MSDKYKDISLEEANRIFVLISKNELIQLAHQRFGLPLGSIRNMGLANLQSRVGTCISQARRLRLAMRIENE